MCLGRAFFGESMFHRSRDASKVALVHLVARLRAGGFTLLDTQFVTDHLKTFGALEVSRRQYHKLLEAALVGEADFAALRREHDRRGGAAIRAGSRSAELAGKIHRAGGAAAAATAGSRAAAAAAAAAAAVAACAVARALAPARAPAGASATAGCGAPLQSVSQTS